MNVVMPNSELNMTMGSGRHDGIIRAVRSHAVTGAQRGLPDDYRRTGVWSMGEKRRSP
jgi:hypothetical protein